MSYLPLATFGSALVISLLLVPIVREFSIKRGHMALPRDDRWHQKPTATLGGIGIFFAFLFSVLITYPIGTKWGLDQWGLLAGMALVFMLGLYDDYRPLSAPVKIIGQIIFATLVILSGYRTKFFSSWLVDQNLAYLFNVILTYIWIVGITNAINLLDNMDGLAGGIGLIAAGVLSFFYWRAGNYQLLVISTALAGSIFGFLVFNFPPASIFMGDSGSMFIGFTLAVLAIAREPQASNIFAVLGVPTLILLLPILDVTFVTFNRILRGKSIIQGGRDHTSHQLIAFGLTERKTLVILYGVAIGSGLIAATLESIQYWYSLIIVPILVLSLALATAYLGGIKLIQKGETIERENYVSRVILDLTFRRRVFEIIFDVFLIGIAYYLAFMFYFRFSMDEQRVEFYTRSLPIVFVATFISFYLVGVYRGIWRYIDINDLFRFLKASLSSLIITAFVFYFIRVFADFLLIPESSAVIIVLYSLFLFLGLMITRSTFRILDQYYNHRLISEEERVLIFRADDLGEFILRWIIRNPQLHLQPVGFVDDDPLMKGRLIHGVKVLGGREKLENILNNHKIKGVIIASVEYPDDIKKEITKNCARYGCWVRCMKLDFELLDI